MYPPLAPASVRNLCLVTGAKWWCWGLEKWERPLDGVDIALLSLFSVSSSSVSLSVIPPLPCDNSQVADFPYYIFAPISLLKQQHGWR